LRIKLGKFDLEPLDNVDTRLIAFVLMFAVAVN
jgi:hypothetical protein